MKTTATFDDGAEYAEAVDFFIDSVSPHTKEYKGHFWDDATWVLDKKITITIEIS